MKRSISTIALASALLTCFALLLAARSNRPGQDGDDWNRAQRGLRISPVPLTFNEGDREQVGLGSYLVNAVASCNDCHTCPSYAAGGNPYLGQPTKINATNFLAGGVPFGPFISANITPDSSGKPEGHTFAEFKVLFQTGHEANGELLQVMPWPIFHNMTESDVHAIYKYLKAIPSASPGTCSGAGEGAR